MDFEKIRTTDEFVEWLKSDVQKMGYYNLEHYLDMNPGTRKFVSDIKRMNGAKFDYDGPVVLRERFEKLKIECRKARQAQTNIF